jgi:hypothetical protein
MLLLLTSLATAGALDCDTLHLTVEIGQGGTGVKGADALLYPDGRPALRDVPDLACTTDTCSQVGDYNWAGLTRTLARVKTACPAHDEVFLVPNGDVRYDVLVASMDASLGAFERVVVGGGAIGMGDGGRGVDKVQIKPGAVMIRGELLSQGVAPGHFDTGGSGTTLRVEATADTPFSEVGQVLRTAGQVGYTTYEHVVAKSGQAPVVSNVPRKGIAQPVIKAKLTSDEIRAGVGGILGPIDACYQDALGRNPGVKGKIVVGFVVEADGTVSASSLTTSTLGDPTLEMCVVGAFMTATFAPPGGRIETSFPLTLSPG